MLRRLCLLPVLSLFTAGGMLVAQAQEVTKVIDFDPPHLHTNGHGSAFRPGLRTQGFYLGAASGDTAAYMYIQPALGPGFSDNGTNYARFLSSNPFSMVHLDGLEFTPKKVDLAEGGGSVTFQGRKADGAVMSVTFDLDDIDDGTGPLADFQTFTFPDSFANIVELKGPASWYYMDNLEVTVHGTETPELPLTPPLIYDIDWNDAPHSLNQPTASGGARAPATSNFGLQYVRGQIGPLNDRPLELSASEDIYDQFGLEAGYRAEQYILEFDTTQVGVNTLAVFFDHTSGFIRTDIQGGGAIQFNNFNSQGGAQDSLPSVSHNAQAASHFRMKFDVVARQVEIALNQVAIATHALPATGALDLNTVRFSVAGTPAVGVDNVRLSALAPTPLLATPAAVNFLQMVTGTSSTMPIRLRNTGAAPVTVTGAVSTNSAFSLVSPTFPTVVAPGESAAFVLKAQPLVNGFSFGRVEFASSAGTAFVLASVKGNNETEPPPPAITFTRQPSSTMVQAGTMLLLNATVSALPTSYEWTRDDVVVPNATGSMLMISQAKLTDAGVYRVRADFSDGSSLTSNAANVGVVLPKTLTSTVLENGRVEAQATAAGPGLTYVWRLQSRVLSGTEPGIQIDGGMIVISPVTVSHHGLFTAFAVIPDAKTGNPITQQAAFLNVIVQRVPAITTTSLPHWRVGLGNSVKITTSVAATSITATGLPPGLTFNATNGMLSGVPAPEAAAGNQPQKYPVTFRARNAVGEGAAVTLDCWVHPDPAMLGAVNFTGIVAPGGLIADTARFGGQIRFSLTKDGAFTSVIRFAHRTVSAAGTVAFRSTDGARAGVLYFKQPFAQELRVRLNSDMLLESEGASGVADGVLSALPALRRLPPGKYQPGLYPTALLAGNASGSDSASPLGTGFLQARLLSSSRLSYAGLLADGTSVTGSEELVADGADKLRVPLFAVVNAGRGSLLGWLVCGSGRIDGEVAWKKVGSAYDKAYPQGFENLRLNAIGDLCPSIAANHAAELGLGGSQATVTFSRAGLAVPLEKLFAISAANRATPVGHASATLTLTPATCSFGGTVNVGTYRGGVVRASYQGVLVPRLGQGVGFVLAPDMSVFRGYSNNMRYLSGPVVLERDSEAD